MRSIGYVDPEYRYADDDSQVLCPGSTFEGEFEPPAQAPNGLAAFRQQLEEINERFAGLVGIPPQAWRSGGRISGSRGGGGPASSPIIDMETVNRLRSMRVTATSPIGVRYYDGLFDYFEVEVARHFPGVQVDRADMRHEERPPLSSTAPAIIDMMWRPQSNEIEFIGGPRHGETMPVPGLDVELCPEIRVPLPVTVMRIRDFDPAAPIQDNIIRYKRFGWNPETRRWVYSTDSDWRPECRYCRRQPVRNLADKYCQGCIRDLIIAESIWEGERYARTHGIRQPVVAIEESYLRGMDLERFRVHVVSWPCDSTQLLLRRMAALAGRTLESFYVNTSGEQAA
ncbi:hypothetical protein [Nocardia xishanensis]|uniref:hypothetical protein n=1 Tax=Nocardia xishanensis TaxID=238964 RepID=UPI001471E757|nr:hypothetical protein [Nocardia xishanensis]